MNQIEVSAGNAALRRGGFMTIWNSCHCLWYYEQSKFRKAQEVVSPEHFVLYLGVKCDQSYL